MSICSAAMLTSATRLCPGMCLVATLSLWAAALVCNPRLGSVQWRAALSAVLTSLLNGLKNTKEPHCVIKP